jgi:hypothetical protein
VILVYMPLRGRLVLGHKWLHVPDALSVFIDTPVTREEAHTCDCQDGLRCPFLGVLVALIDELLRLDVRGKVVRNEIVVTVLHDAIEQGGEALGIAKGAAVNMIEYVGELGLELVLLVQMRVAEVLDILGKVTEQEDVLFANLAGDFNLLRVLVDD